MPTVKPTKPSISLPTAFGTSSSNVKTPFTAQELLNGFSDSIPQVLDGGNLNYIIDAMFQFLTWSNKYADWYASGSPNTVPYINSSNQLDYESPVFGGANNTFSGNNTFTGNITSSGTNTLSGSNTFSGSVSLGSSATATTPPASDNSTKLATTAWLNLAGVKEKIVNWNIPDYANTQTDVGNNYTAPKDGIFWFSMANPNTWVDIKITPNGGSEITYQAVYNGYGTAGGCQVVLGKGDKVVIRNTTQSLNHSYFIPFKGV